MKPNSLKKVVELSGKTIKEIAEMSSVNRRTIERWVSNRASNPGSSDLYKVCKILELSMEQAIDGENGLKYVQTIVPPIEISEKDQDLLKKFSKLKTRDQKEILMLIDIKLSSS